MEGLLTDLINPLELVGFVRGLDPRISGQTLDRFLPDRTRETATWAFNVTEDSHMEAMRYRPFDVEADIGERRGIARVSGKIPPLSRKLPIGEELQMLLAELLGSRAAGAPPEVVRQIFDDAASLTRQLQSRVHLARAQALTTGKVDLEEDRGYEATEIDYTVGGTRPVTALSAPSALWSVHGSATPIADFIDWKAEWKAANAGATPAIALMSSVALGHFLQCAEVKTFLGIPGALTPPIVTEAQLQGVLQALGLPRIETDDSEIKMNGVTARAIAENKVLFLPEPNVEQFGETTWAPTVESMTLVGRGFGTRATAPGITATVWATPDPVMTWTKVSGIVIPVIKDPRKIGETDVLA